MTSIADITSTSRSVPVRSWFRVRGLAILRATRPHLPIYAIAIATYAASRIESVMVGEPLHIRLLAIVSTSVFVVLAGIIAFRLLAELIRLWRSGYAGSPTLALLRYLANDILSPGRVANGVHAYVALGILTVGFTTLKSNIPKVRPFDWDHAFMQLDRTLHFGVLPHEILAPLFQYPVVTFLLNVNYNLWFFLTMAFYIWQGYRDQDGPLRQRFLIAFMLCWVLGTGLIGTIFSSAGPCYYARLVLGANPYAGLMTYLHRVNDSYPIWALATQDLLWKNYSTSKGEISGISAMPSMHVGSSVLFFLCARASGIRWFTCVTGIFAVTIFIGSVMLGWHYAVDGYAGALIALACWWFAGWWVRRSPLSSRPS